MKERILMIGIGQAGSNICALFEKLGYNCMFINTSYDDLKTVEGKHKYHIPAGCGCNKDRKKALNYAKDYYQVMADVIDNKFPLSDIVFMVFSTGGGSGSGISPIMTDYLTKRNPNKYYGAITILPSLDESIKAQVNAIECYKQTISIEELRNLFVLDNNNSSDKLEINNTFATLFDNLINITNPDVRGIIDQAELEALLTCKGNTVITSIEHSDDVTWELNKQLHNSIFTSHEKGCKYMGLSLCDNTDINYVESLFGTPIDTFTGYNEENNIFVATGMPFPMRRINEMIENVEIKQNKMACPTEKSNIIVPKLRCNTDNKPNAKETKKDINFDDIFGKYID